MMENLINSDETMVATKSFDHIIHQIQKSCLNLNLQVSPFSALISLKKSIVKDKKGLPLIQNLTFGNEFSSESSLKIQALEAELLHMRDSYDKVMKKNYAATESINSLQQVITDQKEVIDILEQEKRSARAAAEVLNRKLVDKTSMFEKEKSLIVKDYESQIKSWKKDLGKAVKQHKKLEKKFARFESNTIQPSSSTPFSPELTTNITSVYEEEDTVNENLCNISTANCEWCSICASVIVDYVPQYFMGEMMNPACSKCNPDASDLFFSFPEEGMPFSLVSHWLPPYTNVNQSVALIPSFKSHYVLIPKPGDSFISMEEVFYEMKILMERQLKEMLERFKVS